MPRPKKPGEDGKEVRKRSRNGCWPCKARKVKCGEERPSCSTCLRQGETCDYSIRLNWDGRSKKKEGAPGSGMLSFEIQPSPPKSSPASPPIIDGYHSGLSTQQTLAAGSDRHIQRLPITQDKSPAHSRHGSQDQPLPSLAQFTQGVAPPTITQNHAHLPAPSPLVNQNWLDNIKNASNKPTPRPLLRGSFSFQSYPSPSESGLGSPGMSSIGFGASSQSNQMLPPMSSLSQAAGQESTRSPHNGAKRIRLSPMAEGFSREGRDPTLIPRSLSNDDVPRLYNPSTPNNTSSVFSNPMTPATSMMSGDNTDDRRISVSSLLSEDNSDDRRRSSATTIDPQPSRRGSLFITSISYSETDTYGYDRGNMDLDMPRNNDTQAINGSSPSEHSDFDTWLSNTDILPEFAFGLEARGTVFAPGGYYASPVPIKIPRKLEPLPIALSENPMNLLYFHHFLNHTARILVPHDCPENPFKTVLPKMAVQNPNLLNLMLAYSACHRARLLGHPEPVTRIAHWVRDLFPSLRQTLNDTQSEEVSNANLATAIMLASLEIISPSSFGVSIPWEHHLSLARSLIRTRCGPHSVSRKDPVMYFLTRWLAYLDVLGSLSGRRNEGPLFGGNYWSSSHDGSSSAKELSLTDDDGDDDDDYTIDCLLGFTTRCVSILARVAVLAHQCAEFRIDPITNQVKKAWKPSPDIYKKAMTLQKELEHARNHEQRQCLHHSPQMRKASLTGMSRRTSYAEMSEQEAQESFATNTAFHWAGLVHLLRRVFNLPQSDPQVQNAVHEVVLILSGIREGGSAMACILFPMFTAGVEAKDPLDRAQILSRITGAEQLGMYQVKRARKIMEEVWKTGVSWETLVNGEFFG